MSEIKVNSIKGVNSTDAAITINNTDGTCTANVTSLNGGQLGSRRININGAMTVSQRGTITGITNNASKYGGADRLKNTVVNHGTYTASQEADAPSGTGLVYSHKITTTSAASSPASNARLYIQHKVEKQDLIRLKKGTSDAEQLTVQFYVKGDKTGTYILELFDNISNRHVSATYTISSANTWEKKTITFPGDTGGSAYDSSNGNNTGIEFNFWLAAGSAFTSGSLATTWTGNNDPKRVAGITVNVGDSGYWQITGLQIEVGSVATDFEHRSFGQELALCQRYFQRVNGSLTGIGANATSIRANYTPIVNLRASPTITGNNPVSFNDPGVASPTQSSFDCGIQFTYTPTNIGMSLGFGNFPSNGQTAQGKAYIQWDSANDYIDFTAEL
tara:strand:+ start:850 stop:2016 length:1167 start_codon:yes stop_codon:yes gene_type:complete